MLQLPFCVCFAVFLTFDDNSRNWTSFLANSSNWQLARGCTVIEGTRLCDDGSGGGTRDYTIYFQSTGIHIRSRPVVPGDYNLARTIKIGPKVVLRTSEVLVNHKVFSKIHICRSFIKHRSTADETRRLLC